MGLCLQSYTDVLNRSRENRVGKASECARGVELSVGEARRKWGGSDVAGFELAACPVESAELDGDLKISLS